MSRKTLFAGLLLATFGFLGTAEIVSACTQAPPQPPIIQIIFHKRSCRWTQPNICGIHAWIIIRNYRIFGAGPGQFCGCSLNKVGPIIAIKHFKVFRAGTTIPVGGFCFGGNQGVTNASNQILRGGNFTGFLASVGSQLPSGQTVDLQFEVELQDGTTFAELANALQFGGGAVITGSVNSSGAFNDPAHLDVVTEFGGVQDITTACDSGFTTAEEQHPFDFGPRTGATTTSPETAPNPNTTPSDTEPAPGPVEVCPIIITQN
jgi:hypothetical protein